MQGTLPGVKVSTFSWSVDTLLRDKMLISGATETPKIHGAFLPCVEQLLDPEHRRGALLLTEDSSIPARVEKISNTLGRSGDLRIFRPVSVHCSAVPPPRFNLLSCTWVSAEDYADLLTAPTGGERRRIHFLDGNARQIAGQRRADARTALATAIKILREKLLPGELPRLAQLFQILLEQEVTREVYYHLYGLFGPFIYDEELSAIFDPAENTLEIADLEDGRIILFDLPKEHDAALQFAATIIKRLHLRRLHYFQPSQSSTCLLEQGDGLFLDREDLSPILADRGVIVLLCATSPQALIQSLGADTGDFDAIQAIGNLVLFRHPEESQPSDQNSLLREGITPDQLSPLPDWVAICARRDHPPQQVVLLKSGDES